MINSWIEVIISVLITLLIIWLADVNSLPYGSGKYLAHLGAGLLSILIVMFVKNISFKKDTKVQDFLLELVFGTFLILFIVAIIELAIGWL